jgi:DNA-binding beta-propeller fold protein YncE
VSVINPSTDTVTVTITVGDIPYGVAVSPTGPDAGDIYVTNDGDGTASVIEP